MYSLKWSLSLQQNNDMYLSSGKVYQLMVCLAIIDDLDYKATYHMMWRINGRLNAFVGLYLSVATRSWQLLWFSFYNLVDSKPFFLTEASF